MYSGSRFVTRVLPRDDERHGDMSPSAEGLALLDTLGTDASTLCAALTPCYEHFDIDGAEGHAVGRTASRQAQHASESPKGCPGGHDRAWYQSLVG